MCVSVDNEQELVSLHGVTKSFGRNYVLQVQHLRMYQSERILVLGSNGSGKSTLLRIVAGISRPTHGAVRWSKRMNFMEKGYVPQSGGTNPDNSVLQHLRTMHALYERGSVDPSNLSIVADLRLDEFLHRPIGELSGGFQRLAALAGIISVHPEVVFMDEPLSGLDDIHRQVVSEAIVRLAGSCSLVVVTGHSREDFSEFTRLITLENGRMECNG